MFRVAIYKLVPLAVCIATMAGCATFRNAEPFPKVQKEVSISVSKELPSTWSEMPTGVYAVPESRLFVSGHQGGQAASILFGPLGVLVGSAINAERGKNLVGDGSALSKQDLVSATERFVQDGLAAYPDTNLKFGSGKAGASQLELLPFAVLSYINDTDVRPYVIVRTTLKDETGKEVWSSRYIAAAADARPFGGENGWYRDEGRSLDLALSQSLKRSVDVMLSDMAGKTSRDPKKWMYVSGQYAFVKQPLKLKGNPVVDDADYIAFTPRLGDVVVFTGVNIFDRKTVRIAEATEQDPNSAPVDKPEQTASQSANAPPATVSAVQ